MSGPSVGFVGVWAVPGGNDNVLVNRVLEQKLLHKFIKGKSRRSV